MDAIGKDECAMKMLFVANVLPMCLANKHKLSVAGLKFILSICRSFDAILTEDNLDIISSSNINSDENDNVLWKKRKYTRLDNSKYPIIAHLKQGISFTKQLFKWSKSNKYKKRVVVLINSPAHIAIPMVLFKIFARVKIFSITIDTPFTSEATFKGLLGIYNWLYFKAGHFVLRFFDGIMVHHKNALKCLKIQIPYLVFPVGFDKEQYDKKKKNTKSPKPIGIIGKIKLAYAGTFINYNGIHELLKAFTLLDKNDYELHIFGYGDLQSEIEKYCLSHPNLFLHGRVDNDILLEKICDMDLLINPRLTDESIKYFTFPSKIVEYILSERPVLTTRFASMPHDYLDFVHLIPEENAEGIRGAIEKVFSLSKEELAQRCKKGVETVVETQNYRSIVASMLDFIKKQF